MTIFAKYGNVKGNATHADHRDWMDIETFDWGLERSVNTPTGSIASRVASETTVWDLTLSKTLDESSASLLMEAFTRKSQADLKVHQLSTAAQGLNVVEYVFSNAMITKYVTTSAGDRPMETVSFNFTKIAFNFTIVDETGKTRPVTGEYDLATARMSGR